jgi:hypothetical protein
MNQKRLEPSDEGNTSFVPQDLTNAKSGFDAGAQQVDKGEAPEGHHRLPRKSKNEIPQESLAERLRAKRSGR